MVRADGVRARLGPSAFSALRRRVAHSLTTRREPRNPWLLRRRQSLRAIVLSGCPLLVQPLQIPFQRAFPCAEDIGALAANNSAHQPTAVTGVSDDLFDFDTAFDHRENLSIELFAAKVSFVL